VSAASDTAAPPAPLAPRLRWGLLLLGLMALLMVLGPELAPHDPELGRLRDRLLPPSLTYPLGTDAMGCCLLSRLLAAFRVTPVAALAAVGLSAALGCAVGLLSALAPPLLDRCLMRLVEGVLALPLLAVALVLSGLFGLGLRAMVIAIALLHWADYARVLRNLIVAERGKLYVRAAEALGCPPFALLRRHVLPALCVLLAHSLSWAILTFAGLSFIGLGAEPGTPEFGLMIAESRSHLRSHPQLVLVPGLAIMLFVLALNLLGDRVRDRLPGASR